MLEVSRTRGISTSFSPGDGVIDGEGDRTTEGIRPCPDLVFVSGSGNNIIDSFPLSLGMETAGTAALEGSQSNPGLTIKFTVSPSLTLYSFNNFPSANAFPLRSRR